MKKSLLILALSFSAFAQTRQSIQKQINAAHAQLVRKNHLTPAEKAQDEAARKAMAQHQRELDQFDRSATKAQFLKEHPDCAPGKKCSLGAK